VANKGRGHYGFDRIKQTMQDFYDRGIRILYLQGGEIMTWSDGDLTVDDVIAEARKIGFFKIATVTNGTFPINLTSDMVWVSMDGTEEVHDAVRGKGAFKTVIKNVRDSIHKNIVINITINTINMHCIGELIKFISGESNVKGISVNFHTPYPGVETLALNQEQRCNVLNVIMELKKKGYHIFNSWAGLKRLYTGKYERPVFMINLMENNRVYECCWARDEKDVCDKCGYGIIPELSAIQSMDGRAIMDAFKMFKGEMM
jgi:MoaA/NifB/PqqE/SkfB family radical SAM enzyme